MHSLRAPMALLALIVAIVPAPVSAKTVDDRMPALEQGVSHALARWRAAQYRDVRYALSIRLAPGAATLSGRLELRVKLPKRPVDLVLDWRPAAKGAALRELRVNGKPHAPRLEAEHLVIGRKALHGGENTIALEFESPVAVAGSAVTRYLDREDGSEYVYTLFVPSDASTTFPCFDQPDLKARFRLELELPAGWRAVSNAPAREELEGRAVFAETEPISTYLFAFAAGPFAALTEPGHEGGTRLLVRRSQRSRAIEHAGEVLRLNRESMAFFTREFDHPFPFAKYDLVLIPELAYGGMEHAGATFLSEQAVLFPSAPSRADLLRRASLVFHETSHQWFGDLVTMRWFDDLWLKEGFANFMAAKAAAAIVPELEPWSAFHALKTSAYRTDVTRGTTAIWQPLENLSAAKSAYGAIVYSKGPAVLRQAEFYLGEERFRSAVREFLRRHRYGAADWGDLVGALERASGRELTRWAKAWVQRPGMPAIELHRRGGGVELVQRDTLGSSALWPMRLKLVAADADGALHEAEVRLERRRAEVILPRAAHRARFIYANYGDFGYGRFLLDARSRAAVLAEPLAVPGGLLRAQISEALWEGVRDAQLAPLEFLRYALAVAPQERDEIALAALLGHVQSAFRRYLSDAQRDALAPRLERLLAEGMREGGPVTRRILFFRALAALAWSEQGLAELKALLAGRAAGPGVALSSRDRYRLLTRLLLRGDAEAVRLLQAQAEADRSDDGRRYAFAAGAARADAQAKAALFRRMLEDATLPESWTEEALGALSAPEHAALTRPLFAEALARLTELKRSRKIFFVEHWLGAFVGGQLDAQALGEAQAAARAALAPDLRRKLLENVDGLERAVRIRARYAASRGR
jgi:aminopeptidase N